MVPLGVVLAEHYLLAREPDTMERVQLFWFGRSPTDVERKLVEAHDFVLVAPQPSDDPNFGFGCAALFWATDMHFRSAATCLKKYLSRALNDGLYVMPIVSGGDSDQRLQEIIEIVERTDPDRALAGQYRVRSAPVDLHSVLHQILRHAPGPAQNTSLMVDGGSHLGPEERLLLARAFHDCGHIRLEPIAPGWSGADTFIVYATLSQSNAGPEPMPFFVKLGHSGKLRDEMAKFRMYAEHHVPWYLRPNFVAERSIYGAPKGILVGTFVPDSTSLGECVRAGSGVCQIRSLFENTLAGLRRQRASGSTDNLPTVVDALAKYCDPDKVPQDRCDEAARIFNEELMGPDEVFWGLLGLPPQDWYECSIHGDLHGENVRVRKDDAIVIDFAHAGKGPACADLVHLEVSLAFDMADESLSRAEWTCTVDRLYSPEGIDASLNAPVTVSRTTWIDVSVGEVRACAAGFVTCNEEYKRVLAFYLLRQASFPAGDPLKDEDEYRRAYAYGLACRLVKSLEATASVPLAAVS